MIYVHVPFCRSFCTYCSFYSELACKGKDAEAFRKYTGCLLEEISSRRDEIEASREVDTLYIGGGTPSTLPLPFLEEIVTALGKASYSEFTIEVNPEDIVEKGPGYVSALRSLGVNRISMGVQSLDDGILRWMNRRHNADGARRAFGMLREGGFDNISVALIFGLSNLGDAVLEATLREMISWKPEHVSAYQLSVEEGSALAEMVGKGLYAEADEEKCRHQYELICSTLSAAGYHHYEISNWAVPGREAVHNGAYWTRAAYVGLGPGAHSFDGALRRTWNSEEPCGWTASGETLTPEDVRLERIMLGLRTDRGIPEGLCDTSALERTGGRYRIPESLWFVSDEIISGL